MKTPRLVLTATLMAFAGAAAHAADTAEKNEARLAKMLEGRTAGEPVNCIAALKGNKLEVIEEVGLVYESNGVLYVARPADPKSLGRDDVVVITRSTGQLCTTDIIRTVDRLGGYTNGVVFLDKFVPYTKSK